MRFFQSISAFLLFFARAHDEVAPLAEASAAAEGIGFSFFTHVNCEVIEYPALSSCGDALNYASVNDFCGNSTSPCQLIMPAQTLPTTDPETWKTENCGVWYRIILDTSEGDYQGNPDCASDPCETYEKHLYATVVESVDSTNWAMHQNAFRYLCPYTCLGTSDFCVEDPAHCASGVYTNQTYSPPYGDVFETTRSCRVGLPVSVQEIVLSNAAAKSLAAALAALLFVWW